MADERIRVARLETRAREAEAALRQLKAYIELLRTKKAAAGAGGVFSAEAVKLEQENIALRAELAELKQKLVSLEIRNGVPQIPVSSQGVGPPPVQQQATPIIQQTLPAQAPKAPPCTEPSKEAPKANKKSKKEVPSEPTRSMDVSRLDLRIGRITKAYKHPNADALYVEEVDVGEDKVRIVCSGLTKHVPLEQMQDRVAMFLCNLKPAKMRDVVSQAMIMCASTPEKVEILEPPPNCQPGDRVVCEGFTDTPDAMLNPKKKIFEQIQPELCVNEEGVACYQSTPFKVNGREGVFTAPTLRGVGIK